VNVLAFDRIDAETTLDDKHWQCHYQLVVEPGISLKMSANKQHKEQDKAIAHLFDYIERAPEWIPRFDEMTAQLMQPVALYLGEDVEHITNRLLDGAYGGMAYGFLMELMSVTCWDNEQVTPIDTFLKRRGWREGANGRRYLRALNESEHLLLEVTQVEPNRWVDVRPLGTTLPVERIVEHSASQSLHPYDAMIARVVTLGKKKQFSAILPLTPAGAQHMLKQIDSIVDDLAALYEELGEDETADLVKNFADEIPTERDRRITEEGFMCWAIDALAAPGTELPQLRNTDDDRIVMSKFRFPVTGDKARIRENLNACSALTDATHDQWSWVKSSATNTLLGTLKLIGDHLILETNSVERAEQGVNLVQSLLNEGLVAPPLGVHQNIEDLMVAGPTSSPPPSSQELQHMPQVQALLHKAMKDHYMKTLDEPIPMLDNDSPRTCAADPEKHDKVVGWLKYLENMESKSPEPAQDVTWLWEELGLEQYR
jgi:hypothetical protein